MYRQLDMPLAGRARPPAQPAVDRLHHRGHPGGGEGILREAGSELDRPLTMGLSLVALRCRTADRTPRAMRGVETLAPLLESAARASRRARSGARRRRASAPYDDDLRDSRGCLLEAGGQVDDALDGGRRAGAARRATARSASPRCPRRCGTATGIKVLWLDAHADYNTPATTTQRLPRRHGARRRLRRVGRGPDGHDRLGPRGARRACATSTTASATLLGASGVTVIGASSVETLVAVKNALDGAPVYVHLDLDVIDPEHFPAQFPVARRAASRRSCTTSPRRSWRTASWWASRSPRSRPRTIPGEHAAAAETAMRVIEPFLDRLPSDRQSKK